jgi:hypothetical protein
MDGNEKSVTIRLFFFFHSICFVFLFFHGYRGDQVSTYYLVVSLGRLFIGPKRPLAAWAGHSIVRLFPWHAISWQFGNKSRGYFLTHVK